MQLRFSVCWCIGLPGGRGVGSLKPSSPKHSGPTNSWKNQYVALSMLSASQKAEENMFTMDPEPYNLR